MFPHCGRHTNFARKLFNISRKKYASSWRYAAGSWHTSSQPVALLVIFLLSWGIASSLFPGMVNASSALMRIVFLVMGAQICGYVVSFVGLPGKWQLEWGFVWSFERQFFRQKAIKTLMAFQVTSLDQKLKLITTFSRYARDDWVWR